MATGRQLAAAVEDPDVVEPEEATLEHVAALRILAVDPPGEVQHQLVEHALEECQVALAPAMLAVDLEHAPRGPGMHRRCCLPASPLPGCGSPPFVAGSPRPPRSPTLRLRMLPPSSH